jgi:hypothetical protein
MSDNGILNLTLEVICLGNFQIGSKPTLLLTLRGVLNLTIL